MRCVGRQDTCIRDAVPGDDYCRPCREAREDDSCHACGGAIFGSGGFGAPCLACPEGQAAQRSEERSSFG